MRPPAENPTHVRYVVLLALCLAAGLAYVHRGCLGVAESSIRADLGITPRQTGLALSIFFLTYALFQIPTGLLADRWGARRSMLVFGLLGAFTLAVSAGTMFFGGAIGFVILFVSRLLMGIAQAGLFPASTRCLSVWFPVKRRGFATGTLQACMSVGGAVGAFTTGLLLGVLSWPWVFLVFAVPGVLWSLWFYRWYRDDPAEHPATNAGEREMLATLRDTTPQPSNSPTPWSKLFTSPKLIWVCVQQFFRAAANVFWLTWCPTFLQQVHGMSKENAGQWTSVPMLGVVTGSLLGGILADLVLQRTGSKRWSRQGVAIVGSVVGILFFVLAFYTPAGAVATPAGDISGVYIAIAFICCAAVFSSFGNPCAYSATIDIGGRHTSAIFGSMNMAGNIGATLFPLLVPFWVDEFGWASVLLFIASLYGAGAICWLFLDPNGVVLEEANNVTTKPESPAP